MTDTEQLIDDKKTLIQEIEYRDALLKQRDFKIEQYEKLLFRVYAYQMSSELWQEIGVAINAAEGDIF